MLGVLSGIALVVAIGVVVGAYYFVKGENMLRAERQSNRKMAEKIAEKRTLTSGIRCEAVTSKLASTIKQDVDPVISELRERSSTKSHAVEVSQLRLRGIYDTALACFDLQEYRAADGTQIVSYQITEQIISDLATLDAIISKWASSGSCDQQCTENRIELAMTARDRLLNQK